jgi:hypothetical protein
MTLEEKNGDLIFNEVSEFLKTWPPFYVKFQLHFTKNLRDKNFFLLTEMDLNACQVMKSSTVNIIIRGFLESYLKSSNETLKCPFKKVDIIKEYY